MNTYIVAICIDGYNRLIKIVAKSYKAALDKLVDKCNSEYLDEPIDYVSSIKELRDLLRLNKIYISNLTDIIEF